MIRVERKGAEQSIQESMKGKYNPSPPKKSSSGYFTSRSISPDPADLVRRDFPSISSSPGTKAYKPFLSRDKKLLAEVIEIAAKGPSAIQPLNIKLRRHLVELTDRFLQPLNRHFESLVEDNPMDMTLSNLRVRPKIKPFQQDTFLKQVESMPPLLPLALRKPAVELYRAFLMSPNFASWLQGKTSDVYRVWGRRYIEVICLSDVRGWAGGVGGVETVDLFMRISQELDRYSGYFRIHGGALVFSGPTMQAAETVDRNLQTPASSFQKPSSPLRPRAVENISPSKIPIVRSVSNQAFSRSGSSTSLNDSSTRHLRYFRVSEVVGTDNKNAIGSTIPSVAQYDSMLQKYDSLLYALPEGVRKSVMIRRDPSMAGLAGLADGLDLSNL